MSTDGGEMLTVVGSRESETERLRATINHSLKAFD